MKLGFGLHFFPDVSPTEKSAQDIFDDSLKVAELADGLGFQFVRIVEHYFEPYGGYSPNPLMFLSAASQRTKSARLIPGALLPAFNNPLKMAGEIGMLDAISRGRMEVGFARAFLPHEFERFGISMDESRARFNEGIEAVRQLLELEDVTFKGQFTQFKNVTSLPRPTQRPRPPFWLALLSTPESFTTAGRLGYGVMANPLAGAKMAELLGSYREAWKSAGHLGNGRVMISFRMYCAPSADEAKKALERPAMAHIEALVAAATHSTGWGTGKTSKDYPNYDRIISSLRSETFDEQIKKGSAWVGTPKDIIQQISEYYRAVGGFDLASINGLPHTMPYGAVASSLRLFAAQVMPAFGVQVRAA